MIGRHLSSTVADFPVVALASVMPSDPNQNMAVSLALAGLAFVVT
jgi:hypothetical protein